MAPSISGRASIVVLSYGGWVRCIWIVYTRRRSVEVLQVTGSLVLRILLWCLGILCFHLRQTGLTVTKTLLVSLCRPVHSVGYQRSSNRLCMVTVYITGGTMVSGDAGGSRPLMIVLGSVFAANCMHHGTLPSDMWTWSHRGWSSWTPLSSHMSWV